MNYLPTTMKKLIQLISLGFLSLAAFAAETSTPQALQIRLVADVASSDSEEMIVVGKSKDPLSAGNASRFEENLDRPD
jgi:hypothetical protein